MKTLGVLLGAFLFVSACDSHPRGASSPDPTNLDNLSDGSEYETYHCGVPDHPTPPSCIGGTRPVRSWGPVPYDRPPLTGYCPVRVRVSEAGVVAEAMTSSDIFEPTPDGACIPPQYAVGSRRTFRVNDGWLVAYSGPFDGEVYWTSDDGEERRFISRARLAGFTRAPSGTILALGIGQARLGKGGVIALEHRGRGEYIPRLVATLPLEPSPIAFDDRGRLLTFLQGFVVRIDERGKVENVHYVARDLGKVASIAATPDGDIFLGVDCGVLRLARESPDKPGFREEWWSAKDGASGHWSACPEPQPYVDAANGLVLVTPSRPIY